MFQVTSNGMVLSYYKKIVFIILITNADGLVFVHHESQKDHKGHKNLLGQWQQGARHILSDSISCLCHANISMPSVIWSELSNLRVAPKCHSEHQTLFIHIREGCNETTLEAYFDRLHFADSVCKSSFLWNSLCLLEFTCVLEFALYVFTCVEALFWER